MVERAVAAKDHLSIVEALDNRRVVLRYDLRGTPSL